MRLWRAATKGTVNCHHLFTSTIISERAKEFYPSSHNFLHGWVTPEMFANTRRISKYLEEEEVGPSQITFTSCSIRESAVEEFPKEPLLVPKIKQHSAPGGGERESLLFSGRPTGEGLLLSFLRFVGFQTMTTTSGTIQS